MRIAVTFDNGEIFQHFGHTAQFKFYDVENGKIVKEQVADTSGQGHGALAGFLAEAHADVVICGGIGMGAKMSLDNAGIRVFGGVVGSADQAAADYLADNLSYTPDAACSHHGQEHACGGHSCHEDKQGCAGSHCL